MGMNVSDWEEVEPITEAGHYYVQYFDAAGKTDGGVVVEHAEPDTEPGWANLAGSYAWQAVPMAVYPPGRAGQSGMPTQHRPSDEVIRVVRDNPDVSCRDLASRFPVGQYALQKIRAAIRSGEL